MTNSIKVDDVVLEDSKYTYDDVTGKLTITLEDIPAKNTKKVTFEVSKK